MTISAEWLVGVLCDDSSDGEDDKKKKKLTKRGAMKWYSGTDTLYMIFTLHTVGG